MNRFGTRTTRRSLIAGAGALGIAGLIPAALGRTQEAAQTLRLLCWPGYDDPKAIEGFRDATGAELRAEHIGANDEIFTFLRAGGTKRYDVVTPTNGVVQALAQAGLIQPLDLTRLANVPGLFQRFQSPDWAVLNGQTYALPLSWHTAPMIYNADKLPVPPKHWTDLVDPKFKGKVVMNDDVIAHFLTWNRVLGAADPARVTKIELMRTARLLTTIKHDRALAYVGDMTEVAKTLATGGGWVSTTGWEIAPSLDTAKGANLRLARPNPGDFSACYCLCLTANAPNLDLAYTFLDHMVSVDAQVALADSLHRGTVSEAAVPSLTERAGQLFDYGDLDAVFTTSPLVGFPPLEADAGTLATYVDWVVAWDQIRFTPLQANSTPTPTPSAKLPWLRTPTATATTTNSSQ